MDDGSGWGSEKLIHATLAAGGNGSDSCRDSVCVGFVGVLKHSYVFNGNFIEG